ncbi:MAG: hypothetical protein ABL907_10185 [Hyphomicrobium sp.]
MDALQSRLRLAPGIWNIGGTGEDGNIGNCKKRCYINELPFASKDHGKPSLQGTSDAPVPVIGVAVPVNAANHPDPAAKFPVISAAYFLFKSLILRIQSAHGGRIQAKKPIKYPVIETRSPQTAYTATQSAGKRRLRWPVPEAQN